MEAVSGAALTVQFADVGGRALLGMIRLLKDLKETPKRMVKLLQDVDKSVQRICSLQNAIQQPASLFTDLSTTQIQRLTGRVDDAYHATVQLQHSLEPLFRKNNSAVHEWAKKGWRSIISIQIERSIAENVARTERLNREVLSELQLIDLEMGANIKYPCLFGGPHGDMTNTDLGVCLHKYRVLWKLVDAVQCVSSTRWPRPTKGSSNRLKILNINSRTCNLMSHP